MKKLLLIVLLFATVGSYAADFVLYAKDDCVPCTMMRANLAALQIKTFDGVKNSNDHVYAYPTLVVVVNNTEVERIVGYIKTDKLSERLAPYMLPDTCKPTVQVAAPKRVECEVCKKNLWASTHVYLDGKPVLKAEIIQEK